MSIEVWVMLIPIHGRGGRMTWVDFSHISPPIESFKVSVIGWRKCIRCGRWCWPPQVLVGIPLIKFWSVLLILSLAMLRWLCFCYTISRFLNFEFLCLLCMFWSPLFLEKHKYSKELHYKRLPNEEFYWEIFGPNSATGCMAYEFGSAKPLHSQGVVIEDPTAPLYEDMSIGDEENDTPVTASPPVIWHTCIMFEHS